MTDRTNASGAPPAPAAAPAAASPAAKEPPPVLTLTERAAEELRRLARKEAGAEAGQEDGAEHGPERNTEPGGAAALRVGVRSKGCNGLRYYVERATETSPRDLEVASHGVRLLIDGGSLLYLVGSEMDWESGELRSGFVFRNPNETSRCGCGESFSVAEDDPPRR